MSVAPPLREAFGDPAMLLSTRHRNARAVSALSRRCLEEGVHMTDAPKSTPIAQSPQDSGEFGCCIFVTGI